jgi:hypothetical protein
LTGLERTRGARGSDEKRRVPQIRPTFSTEIDSTPSTFWKFSSTASVPPASSGTMTVGRRATSPKATSSRSKPLIFAPSGSDSSRLSWSSSRSISGL